MDDQLTIIPLGAGCEVGRSCIVLKYKGKTVMFDCGVHAGLNGMNQLPFFDIIDPSTIDLLLVTHFHLDHCGALPYFLEQTSFKGKVYMTFPTKSVYKLLLSDSAKVSAPKSDNMSKSIFNKEDLNNSLPKIHTLNYHQELEYNGIKFKCYNAGHVIGAAMFLIEIDGVKILYTGDFSCEEDRHLQPAEIPNCQVNVLIVESTYGIKLHESRQKREKRLTTEIYDIIKRGGKVLLPVFALGRAQEILLILEEFWSQHQDLHDVNVYYPCALAAKCMVFFQSYLNMLGPPIQEKFKNGINPFKFRFIQTLKNLDNFQDNAPSIIMASPGMIQNGLSREIFEKWCHDPKNGCIITGYCVDNTLAKVILNQPDQITKLNGEQVDLRMTVSCISFSAHADYKQTSEFIKALKPKNVVLVHGERHQCKQLQQELQKNFEDIQILMPQNCQEVRFSLEKNNTCFALGKLCEQLNEQIEENKDQMKSDEVFKNCKNVDDVEEQNENMDEKFNTEFIENMFQNDELKEYAELEGSKILKKIKFEAVLTKQSGKFILINIDEIQEYTSQNIRNVSQKLYVKFTPTLKLAHIFCTSLFEDCILNQQDNTQYIIIQDSIFISKSENHLLFQWVSSSKNDFISDQLAFLFSQFPDDQDCDLFQSMIVTSENQVMKKRIEILLEGIRQALQII